MDKWIVLGIEKTDDEEAVKAAYRKKLATVNPEDDSEGFMELRKAYEDALYEIKNQKKNDVNEDEDNDDISETKDAITEKISKIYNDFSKRVNPKEWEKLFLSDEFVSLETCEEAKDKLLSFLMDRFRLPQEVWKLIYDEFDLETNKEELLKKYPRDFTEFIIDAAKYRNYLNYKLFYPESNFKNVDKFIEYYFDLKSLIRNQEMTEADLKKQEELIDAMEKLEIGHPYFDMLKLFCELNEIKFGDKGNDEVLKSECAIRLTAAEDMLNDYPDDFYMLIYCGDLADGGGDYVTAKKYYRIAYEQNKKDYLASHKLAGVLYMLEEYKEAEDIFIDLISANESDYMAHNGLTECNKRLIEVYEKKLEDEPDNSEYKLEISWAYYRVGELKKAIEMLTSFKADELNCQYFNLLGRCLFYEKEYENALENFNLWAAAVKKLNELPESELTNKQIEEKKRYPYICFWIGSCYEESGDYDKAREYLKKAISIEHPEVKFSYEALCRMEFKLRNYEECIRIAKEIFDKFGDNYTAYIHLAKSYYELDELNKTIDVCEQIIKLYPYYYEAYKLEMELYEYVEQYEDIKYTIERYDSTGAKSDQIEYFRAWWLGEQEDKYEESNKILFEILDKKYNSANTDMDDYNNVYWLLTRNFEMMEMEDEAIKYYEEVLTDEPKDIFFLKKLGNICHVAGYFEKAIETYDKVINYSKNERNVIYGYLGKAAANSCMGRYEESAGIYDECISRFGYDKASDCIVDYAELMIRMNNFEGCEKLLKHCIENSTDENFRQSCVGNLCCFYGNENYLDKSYEMFELAVKFMPDDYLIYRSMGNIYLEHEKYEEAIKLFKEGLKIDKEKRAFICETLLIAIGKLDDVNKDEYKEYRDIAMEQCESEDTAYSNTRKAEMYRGLKEYDKALEAVNNALNKKRSPLECFYQDPDAWDEKGNIYFEMGDLENALICFKKAVEIFGHYEIYESKVRKVMKLLGQNED